MRKVTLVSVIVVSFLAGSAFGFYLLPRIDAGASTQCDTNAAGEVRLQVVNSTSGEPIASASVFGEVGFPDCSNSYTSVALNTTLTNGTGFAFFGPEIGTYHLTVQAHGNYFVDASTRPEQTTCVTLSIPSGETVTKYSGTFQFNC